MAVSKAAPPTQVQISEFNDRFKWRAETCDRDHKPSTKSNHLVGQWKNESFLFVRPGNMGRTPDPLASSLTMANAKQKTGKMITSAHHSRPRTHHMRMSQSAPSFTGVEVALARNGQLAPGAALGPPPSSAEACDSAASTMRSRAQTAAASSRQVGHCWGGSSHLSATKGSALLQDAMGMTQMSSTWASNNSRGDGRWTGRRISDPTAASGFRHPKDRWYPKMDALRGTVKFNPMRAIDSNADPGKEWGLDCPMWDAHNCRITHAQGLEHVALRTPKKAMRWRSQELWGEAAHHPVFKVNHIAPT